MPSREHETFLRLAEEVELLQPTRAPSRVKAKIYSALMQQQAQAAPLMSLSEVRTRGEKLCVFERLVQIAPVGESVKSLNICRVCGMRALAERFDDPPIFWSGCPYVDLKNS